MHAETARQFGVPEEQLRKLLFDPDQVQREARMRPLTTCLFSFMNRLLNGHGCTGDEQVFKERGLRLAREGYAPLLKALE